MPLTGEDKLTLEHAFLATGLKKSEKMSKSLMPEFFSQLGINASPELQNMLMDGLTFRGTVEIGYDLCETFFTVWRDNDRLGLLKICFRGRVDRVKGPHTISLTTLTNIGNLLGVQKSEAEIRREVGNQTEFTFPNATQILLGIHIPEDGDAFEGVVPKKSCILI